MDKQNNSTIYETDYCLLRTSGIYFQTIPYHNMLITSSHHKVEALEGQHICTVCIYKCNFSPCWTACNCVGLRRSIPAANWEQESFSIVCELIFYELRVGFEPNRDLDVPFLPISFYSISALLHITQRLVLCVYDCIHSFLALWLIVSQATP